MRSVKYYGWMWVTHKTNHPFERILNIYMSLSPACPICACDSRPIFYAGDNRMFRCNNCALAFVHPIPPDEYLTNFYSRFHAHLEEGGGYEMTESRVSADFPAKIRMIQEESREKKIRLLDVGCGKGFFVKACLDVGIEAEGIDLSDTAIRFATEVLSVKATCGKIEDAAHSLGQFDVVTFWATIEHLAKPIETLRAINSVLKPGGVLFLDTGVGDDWLDRVLPGFNQWYDPPQHLYVFSQKAMLQLLSQAGFEIKKINSNFERNTIRLLMRTTRAICAAVGLRIVSEIARCGGKKQESFGFTRFPLGNLMSVVALKK